jgi:hypothetical protein
MIPLHAVPPEIAEKVQRRRTLINQLVGLEDELLAARVISRRVVMTKRITHERRVYCAELDDRSDL